MNLTITEMGARGEGLAAVENGPVHVPFTLPDEKINAAVNGGRGIMISLLEASPERKAADCAHFEHCGGCALQHWQIDAQREWKRKQVQDALAKRGIRIEVLQTFGCEAGDRRKVAFSVREVQGRKVVGFNAAHSHDVIEIIECPVAAPQIVAALPIVRDLAKLFKVGRDGGHIAVTLTESGLDMHVSGIEKFADEQRRKMSAFALANGLARLSADEEVIVEPKRPFVHFGVVPVTPPPGGFLQASAQVEAAMAELVVSHFSRAKKVADLFSGSGAFTFRLAARTPVLAVEADNAAVAALDKGRRGLQGLKAITVEQRDLFRRPLMVAELKAFDAVVFDPPRAGAEEQAKMLAKSGVRWIAAVSCNPATLARDLRILIDGGYALKSVTPFDQFLWSAHVEAVALLENPHAGSGPRKIFG